MLNLREIPPVNTILDNMDLSSINLPRAYVMTIVRNELTTIRMEIQNGQVIKNSEEIFSRIMTSVESVNKLGLKRVINATGIVLHTGLGRAPLSPSVLKKTVSQMEGYTSLELDLTTGKRGDRTKYISSLLNSLTGAEASLVVNNNAAAVLLAINTLADNKEIIISRGQLVEIGGSFRIPDVIAKSGAKMMEIGTTNRTHFKDYKNALSNKTGAILIVHTSNYRVEGFTSEVGIKELSELCKKKRIPLIVDLGSGALFDLSTVDIPKEPVVRDVLKLGASLVMFSGDKLLGGPQAGLICGEKRILSQIFKNPLYRVLRCDKVIISLLENTLKTYKKIPPENENLTYSLLLATWKSLQVRGESILSSLESDSVKKLELSVVPSWVEAGSGSLPTEKIESAALRFRCKTMKPTVLAQKFREWEIPIIGYITGNRFYIDLKAVLPEEDTILRKAIHGIGLEIGE
ncbi:MAG: L-seryl-tRNA(Sec) selenium transferase [Candidatus Marinimicrobia bacterium]|nr:L-seryl-tRNA(Sec) selenium transferase [Candidatus Neomarinimicrobiota bacterium]